MKKIVILRGVPGTGKSTFSLKYLERRRQKYPDEDIALISRDGFRMMEVKYSETEYQRSFRDSFWNEEIIRRFWGHVRDMFNRCDVLILDSTMCKYQDIYALYWYLFEYMAKTNIMVKIRWKVLITEYGSRHGVPAQVMHKYWDEFNDTMSYIECHDYFVVHDDEVVPADEKVVYVG